MEFFLRFIILLGALRVVVVAMEEDPVASFLLAELFASRSEERAEPIQVACNVCGDGKAMQNLSNYTTLAFLDIGCPEFLFACRDIFKAAQRGLLASEECAAFQAEDTFAADCGCKDGTFAPSPSISPSPYWARSSSPTPSSFHHYSYYPTPLYTPPNYNFTCSICGENRYMEYPDAFLFNVSDLNCTYLDNYLVEDEEDCEGFKSAYELETLCGCTKIPTTKKKLGKCETDCDKDSDCKGKLICADEHKKELRKAGYDPRKANCGTGSQNDRYLEVCFDPTILK